MSASNYVANRRSPLRKLFLALALLCFSAVAYAQDSKVSALPDLAAPAASDIVYCVSDPGGSAASKKCTVDNLLKSQAKFTRRVCMLQVGNGTDNIVTGDFSPFLVGRCYVPYAATIVEITAQGDAGTSSFLLERRRDSATVADLMSGALASAGTTEVCVLAKTSGTCINGTTSDGTVSLSNTALAAGDWIEVKSGTAAGSTKSLDIAVVFTVD